MLPASKTDPYRKGTAIQLASTESPLCPVKALVKLFQNQPKQPTAPLFSRSHGRAFNRAYVIDQIKEMLLRSGISAVHFSGHSIRKSAAVSAAAQGISKEDIKLLGRWKSDAVDIYINELAQADKIAKLLHLNSRLHTPQTKLLSPFPHTPQPHPHPIHSYHLLPWLQRRDTNPSASTKSAYIPFISRRPGI